MSPGPASTAPLLRGSGGGGAVAPGHVTTAAGAGVSAAGGRGTERGYYTLAAAGCWPPLIIATLATQYLHSVMCSISIQYLHTVMCSISTQYLHNI